MDQQPPARPSGYTVSTEFRERQVTALRALFAKGRTPAEAIEEMDAAVKMVVHHVFGCAEIPPAPNQVSTRAIHLSSWHIVFMDCAQEFPWPDEGSCGQPSLSDPSPEYTLYYEQQKRDHRKKQFLDTFWHDLASGSPPVTQVHQPRTAVAPSVRSTENLGPQPKRTKLEDGAGSMPRHVAAHVQPNTQTDIVTAKSSPGQDVRPLGFGMLQEPRPHLVSATQATEVPKPASSGRLTERQFNRMVAAELAARAQAARHGAEPLALRKRGRNSAYYDGEDMH